MDYESQVNREVQAHRSGMMISALLSVSALVFIILCFQAMLDEWHKPLLITAMILFVFSIINGCKGCQLSIKKMLYPRWQVKNEEWSYFQPIMLFFGFVALMIAYARH